MLSRRNQNRVWTWTVAAAQQTTDQLVDISHLPETAYEHLVGRAVELKRLDDAFVDRTTNILSLIAEGGAGKSALVNEWLKKLQAENYRVRRMGFLTFSAEGDGGGRTSAGQFLDWELGAWHRDRNDQTSLRVIIAEAMVDVVCC